MFNRRDLLIGAGCFTAAGVSLGMKPHRRMDLLGATKLETLMPKAFGNWKAEDTGALIAPPREGSLEDKLYNQVVSRAFSRPDGATVMLLIAYGNAQTDLLQLHRPEVCYPFFGFTVLESHPQMIPVAGKVEIPGRALTATNYNRTEQILYWARVGEYLPQTGNEQLLARLKSQIAGWIVDGVLVRISTVTADVEEGLAANLDFARELVKTLDPRVLRPLLGTQLTQEIAPHSSARA
ncbi:exosortase-associated protein EpsI, V-type [Sphingomonas sp. TDK1]|uniref:exosortase-associated protein EpsI, V-type n=1 Tax=Sphingomonas sp. TDK1 TaxID=453247 RepID=UPI0007D9FFF2|nr:exosortase-associated protein EpsI, V-type [Sphingomonas sp. TDK1]OAN66853.1 EpsI family protein [Sphingomonas sp. TDK1]